MTIDEIGGGVTAPEGFLAGGLFCGVRRSKKDLAIIASRVPAVAAGVFTQNKLQAAPILVTRAQMKKTSLCSAVVVNSGNANACTGERGLNDAWAMIHATAGALDLPEEQVLVSSTGVIGEFMPIGKITKGIAELAPLLSTDGAHDAAEAIMTTDTCSKEYAVRCTAGDTTFTIGAMAKGSGMIAPNMATMLGFVTTDLAIPHDLLAQALSDANRKSFNRITVEGDMSTNDMVLVLANGLAGNAPVTEDSEVYALFRTALEQVLIKLAKTIARDGEGATKLIEVLVTGAATEDEAEIAAKSVANSNLVKTAIHGADANWGRVIAAVGYSRIDFQPDQVTIAFNGLPILNRNYEVVLDEERAKEVLQQEKITIAIDLGQGSEAARVWTCDLTKDYIHINASYRT